MNFFFKESHHLFKMIIVQDLKKIYLQNEKKYLLAKFRVKKKDSLKAMALVKKCQG